MSRIPVLVLALCLTPGASLPAATDERPRKIYDAETLYDTVTLSGGAISSDESTVLITSDETGVLNIYAQPIDGGERRALSASTDRAIRGIDFFPNDDRVLYTSDGNGDELNHLYVRELDGTVVDLTPGDGLKAMFMGWSGDRSSFYVGTNERDPRAMDVYRYSFAERASRSGTSGDYPRRMVFRNDDHYQPSGVSGDERWLALVKVRNNEDNNLFVVDLTRWRPAPRLVSPHEGNATFGLADFSPDSSTLYYTTDEGSEFRRVFSYDIATGHRDLEFEAEWDVQSYRFSTSGRYLVISTNEDATTRTRVVDTRTGADLRLPAPAAGTVRGVRFSPSDRTATLTVNGDRAPTNIHALDVKTGRATALTRSLSPRVDADDLVESTVVRYPSFDGVEIPALLYRPHQATGENRAPGVVLVHGGPGGQSRSGYRAEVQYLVNHGYAVLAVNNRGSSGYGKTFYHLDDRRHGEHDLQDCVFGRTYLESLDWIDGERVAIMGGSYGGYMVAAALAFTPDAFDAGVNIFGVTNWLRTLESIPPWWEAQREALYAELGDPKVDRERLHRISPLFHADRIKRPLLVVQGANDPRVLQVESDELVAAARKGGAEVEYLLFEDEGHGFRKKENRIEAAEAYLRFLDTHLRSDPGS